MATSSPSLDMTAEPDRFDEAIVEFSKRRIITKAEADAMVAYSRRRAWWIAGVAQMDVANDVHASIKDAMDRGIPFEEWKSAVEPKLTDAWGRENSPRVLLIFRNATMQAANAGRWDQMHNPAVLQVRPYLQFDAVRDSRECERCEACNGVTLPADDPWWLTHSPILHHACRCGVRNKRQEFGEKHLTTAPPVVSADEGFGIPPDQAKPPTPTERKKPPAPEIHAEFTQKTFQHNRESKPVVPKIPPQHTPEFWESKYEHYGEAKKAVAYGRALLARAKDADLSEALKLLNGNRNEVPGISLDLLMEMQRGVSGGKRANLDQDAIDAGRLLAQCLQTSGRQPPEAASVDAGLEQLKEKAHAWYSKLCSEKLNIPALHWKQIPEGALKDAGRAYAEPWNFSVFLSRENYVSSAVHEVAHCIEWHNPFAGKVRDFRAHREAGQQLRKLRDITGDNHFGDDEVAFEDKYYSAYMGSEYGDRRISEVISVVVGAIAGGNIKQLLQKDPESLFFVLGLLAGV